MTTLMIAEEIHRDIGEIADVSQSLIAFFVREHIGELNNLIDSSYSIDPSNNSEIIPELGEDEKAIMKKLYMAYFYAFIIQKNLGAAAFGSFLDVSSDGATVRTVSPTQIAQNYISLRRDTTAELKDLVNKYRANHISPSQVAGDDNFGVRPNSHESTEFWRNRWIGA